MPAYSGEGSSSASSILLRPEEVARELRVSRSAVYVLLSSGELRSIAIGRRRRIPRAELDAYIARKLANAPAWDKTGTGE